MSDTKTIASQLIDAHAEIERLKSVIERQPAMKHFHEACTRIDELKEQVKKLSEENAALKSAAEQSKDFEERVSAEVSKRVAAATQELEASINKRADARAVEIMATVGQPAPAAVTPAAFFRPDQKPSATGPTAMERAVSGFRKRFGR